jgi:hypothetical protein
VIMTLFVCDGVVGEDFVDREGFICDSGWVKVIAWCDG